MKEIQTTEMQQERTRCSVVKPVSLLTGLYMINQQPAHLPHPVKRQRTAERSSQRHRVYQVTITLHPSTITVTFNYKCWLLADKNKHQNN